MIDNDLMLCEAISDNMHTSIRISATCAISDTSGTNLSMSITQLENVDALKIGIYSNSWM